jgi:hypothetical protein
MEVAIRTSGIVGSLLCALCKADLRLFNNRDNPINPPPRTVREAVKFGRTMRASSCTAPAVSLKPYLDRKDVVKTFIVVTDEEENTNFKGNQTWHVDCVGEGYFADTFAKYIRNVYRAKLIFITFTDKPNQDGRMVGALKEVLGEAAVEELVSVFKFGLRNPDLRKLDVVLAKLSEMREENSEEVKDPDVPAQVTDPTRGLAHLLTGDDGSETITISKDLLNQLFLEATRRRTENVNAVHDTTRVDLGHPASAQVFGNPNDPNNCSVQ